MTPEEMRSRIDEAEDAETLHDLAVETVKENAKLRAELEEAKDNLIDAQSECSGWKEDFYRCKDDFKELEQANDALAEKVKALEDGFNSVLDQYPEFKGWKAETMKRMSKLEKVAEAAAYTVLTRVDYKNEIALHPEGEDPIDRIERKESAWAFVEKADKRLKEALAAWKAVGK